MSIPFHLISLGCPKNRVDSERALAAMFKAGFEFRENIEDAEVVIINTCAFIEPAVEESIDTILDARDQNEDALLVVLGCLHLRYGDDARESLPEVSLFVNPDRIDQLPYMIRKSLGDKIGHLYPDCSSPEVGRLSAAHSECVERALTTPGYAYLRIAEGCGRRCAYCSIPQIRGPLRSVDPQQVEDEARCLASLGARELVLVAQELTAYGRDKADKGALMRLLERLTAIEEIRWIRLMYLHPSSIPSELPLLTREAPTILPYLDIPLQHVAEKVLRAMGRRGSPEQYRSLVESLREQIPGLVLRTTLMVGFPNEGDREFDELHEFVSSMKLEHVGVFTYSPEEGTPAHGLGDPVPTELKVERAEALMGLHAEHASLRNAKRIGAIEDCLVEGFSAESDLLLEGRVWDQAPEVDGVLYITEGEATAGEIMKVRITDSHGFDLFGKLLS